MRVLKSIRGEVRTTSPLIFKEDKLALIVKKISVLALLLFVALHASAIIIEGPILVLGPDDADTPRTSQKYYKSYNFFRARDVLISEDDLIYVLEKGNACITYFNMKGDLLGKIGGIGQGPSELYEPTGMAFVGSKLWVADFKNNRIQEFAKVEGKLEYVKPIKPTKMNMPMHIAVVGENVVLASTSIHPLIKGITAYDINGKFKKQITIDPGLKTQKTMSLWAMAKIVDLNNDRLLVGYKYVPTAILIDKNLEDARKIDLSAYYSRFEDKRNGVTFPAGYAATAFSGGPNNSVLIAACDNKKRSCHRILQFNHDLSRKIGNVDLDFHVWDMKYFPKKKLMVFISNEDEVVFYNAK